MALDRIDLPPEPPPANPRVQDPGVTCTEFEGDPQGTLSLRSYSKQRVCMRYPRLEVTAHDLTQRSSLNTVNVRCRTHECEEAVATSRLWGKSRRLGGQEGYPCHALVNTVSQARIWSRKAHRVPSTTMFGRHKKRCKGHLSMMALHPCCWTPVAYDPIWMNIIL
ncbi:hypothetical protein BKA93DRAFT_294112 [Sparassis latifolia]